MHFLLLVQFLYHLYPILTIEINTLTLLKYSGTCFPIKILALVEKYIDIEK